ncbi:MAG: bifunctional metallophosphatase/5'-nucleotidase [Pseudomonadota bacterium]
MPPSTWAVKRIGFDLRSAVAQAFAMMCRCVLLWLALICAAEKARADFTLTILHTNDFHARFEPIDSANATCQPADALAGACYGGSARLITAIRDARAEAVNPVLFDGGDQFQGSLFYTYYKGQLAAEMMNALGYDAMTVGNHEFDNGPEVLRRFIDAVRFPVLMANADLSREPLLNGVLPRSAVIEVAGQRIGLIGLVPENTGTSSSPGPNITFGPAIAAVKAEVGHLEGEGIDKIILLSHSGYDVDLRIARETRGIDVIVGGHSHTLLGRMPTAAGPYPTMVDDTAVVQAYAYGKYLGRLVVTFDTYGQVADAQGAPILIDAAIPEDRLLKTRIARAAEPLEDLRRTVVGEAVAAIDGGLVSCRVQECPLGNLMAEAMLERTRAQGAEIALMNGGGLRAVIGEGPVTMEDVLTTLPFQNTLSTVQVSGRRVLEALENGVSQYERGAGRFPHVAGMRYAFDPFAPPGTRIVRVEVGETPLDPGRDYLLATNSYVRRGGDGYDMLSDARDAYDFGPGLSEVLAEYLGRHSPYVPFTDGRIEIMLDAD